MNLTRESWIEIAIREGLLASWWVILFSLVCYGAFEVASARSESYILSLRADVAEKEAELRRAHEEQEELRRMIAAEADPAWVELTLMRCLGVVPEGQTKVFFLPARKP